MKNIDKSFPGVHALKNVSISLRHGEVHGLIGQDYPKMGSLGVETLYKLIKGEEVDLGDETHYIDTGYELVDLSNYEEVWATKTPW